MLVTSRNKDVLTSSGIAESYIYKVDGLNAQHSRELFCWHAFRNPHPVEGFVEVVNEFLDASAGLPSFLIMLGALLHGKDLGDWNAQLHKLSERLPSDIRSRLKASYYDGLDGEEKEMFLDIACFFIGEDRDTAIRVWDASGWKGSLGLRKLEDRFLVEIDSKYRIRMYDPLRHLGKDLAEEEPTGCELRVWRHNLSAQSPVRGISMVYRNLDQQFWEKVAGSCNLSRLQLLRVRGYSVESIFSVGQLPQLTYLRGENCPNSVLPSWNPLKNLRVLHIQGKNLGTLWQRESQAPLQLRELNMDAPLLEVPKSIGKLKHLEKFVLHQSNLETLPDEFCHVDSLIHVELKNCQKIRLLPDSVGNLTNLQRLDLSKCSNLEMLPYSLGNLRNLQHINLSKCSNLRMLPNFLDNLKHLQHMDLSGCSNLQILPNSLGNLKNLQHIDLSRCLNLQMLPNSFGNLTNLQHIELSGCSNLPILPNSFGNLIQLKHLCLRKCYDLTISSETLGQIRTLEWLEISGCYGIDVLPPQITHQRFLREMYLFCPFLKELPSAIGDLSHLEVLHLTSSCLELLEIGTLVSLEKLQTRDCVTLKSIQGLAQLTKLRTLDVTNCPVLEELPGVEHLRSLKECGASGCPKQVQEQLETALSISRM
jgi:Leucine-rich repeat (LRR) protein